MGVAKLSDLPAPPSGLTGFPWTEESTKTIEGIEFPKISIITPSFNQAQYLEQTIRSVLLQNYPNLEYIIIDGGSTDNSVEIISKYQNWISYWVSEKDNGQSDALNKGLSHCTGDIFNWINSDDYLEANALNHVAEAFISKNVDVVCGNCRVFDGEETVYTYRLWHATSVEQSVIMTSYNQPSTFYSMKFVREFGTFNSQLHYCMDLEMWYKYFTKNGFENVVNTNALLSHFRYHSGSKTIALQDHFLWDRARIIYSIARNFNLDKKTLLRLKFLDFDNYYKQVWDTERLNSRKVKAYFFEWIALNFNKELGWVSALGLYFKSIITAPFRSYTYTLYFLGMKYISEGFRKKIRRLFSHTD